MSIQLKGLKAQQPLKEKNTPLIQQSTFAFDGYSLDYMHISADLTKQQDFEDLIKLLEVHKYCFWRPSEPMKITLNKKP